MAVWKIALGYIIDIKFIMYLFFRLILSTYVNDVKTIMWHFYLSFVFVYTLSCLTV